MRFNFVWDAREWELIDMWGFRAHCIGANHSTATSLLRQDYKEDIGLEEALELAVKVLSKTMDSTTLDHEKGTSNLTLAYLR